MGWDTPAFDIGCHVKAMSRDASNRRTQPTAPLTARTASFVRNMSVGRPDSAADRDQEGDGHRLGVLESGGEADGCLVV